MELAQGGAGERAMGHAVDHAAAHAADAFAAIVVERHGLFVLRAEVLVQHVQHFEERHFVVDVGDFIAHHPARIVGVALPPDVNRYSHYLELRCEGCTYSKVSGSLWSTGGWPTPWNSQAAA